MKKTTLFIALALCGAALQAQEFTRSLSGVDWVKIETKSTIHIEAHASGQLLIRGQAADPVPDKAKGLKLVGEGGTDNTGAGFYLIEEGNTLILRNLLKSEADEVTVYLPASQNVSVLANGLGDVTLKGMQGEVEVTSEVVGSVTLTDITGPVTAHSNTGNVEIVFGKVNQGSPISVSTATGDVDISLPAATPANLELASTMGNIYTNFDITAPEKNGLKAVSAQNIEGAINRGGVKISLNSATGNIFLRKK